MHAYRLEYVEILHDCFSRSFFFSYFPPSFVHLYLCVFLHVHCRYVFLCLFALNNQRERTQRHCNYNHYYHKNNLSLYSCTRRTHLIESISFADDGFTFCHGRCCLISMPWKYAFFFFLLFRLISAASTSSAADSLSVTLSFSLYPPLSLSLSDYLTNITTTSREMMVIGHFGLGQLLTWKRKWLQLGVLGANLFNSFPSNNQDTSFFPPHSLYSQ